MDPGYQTRGRLARAERALSQRNALLPRTDSLVGSWWGVLMNDLLCRGRRARYVFLRFAMLACAAAGSVAAPAADLDLPLFGRAWIYGYGGPGTGPGSAASDESLGAGLQRAEAGSKWWCDSPGCSISIPPAAGLGWGEAEVWPAAGAIRARTGAHSLNGSGAAVSWQVGMPPFTFTITPPYWGESQSASYLRSVWRVQSANGSLQPGDPVSVEASIALDGTLDAPRSGVSPGKSEIRAAVLLNKASTAVQWLGGNDYLAMGTLEDMIGLEPPPTFAYRYAKVAVPGAVNRSELLSQTFAVGDVIVMETLLDSFAGVANLGQQGEYWADFNGTLRSSIVATSPGAMLVPVPEPSSLALLGFGGLALAARAWRRRLS